MSAYRRSTIGIGLVALCLTLPMSAFAQKQEGPARGQRAAGAGPGRAGGRGAAAPALRAGMTVQQLQNHIDAVALIEAQKQLKLTDEQYPAFAAKLTRLQTARTRLTNQRRRAIMELRALLDATPVAKDDAITEKVKELEDINRRGADEIVKSFQDLDAVLTPWQRGRFRLFEEQLERRKIELLSKIGPPVPGGGK